MMQKKSQQFSLTKALHAWLNILKKDTWRNSSAKHVQKIFFAVPQKKKQVFRLELKKTTSASDKTTLQSPQSVRAVSVDPAGNKAASPVSFKAERII